MLLIYLVPRRRLGTHFLEAPASRSNRLPTRSHIILSNRRLNRAPPWGAYLSFDRRSPNATLASFVTRARSSKKNQSSELRLVRAEDVTAVKLDELKQQESFDSLRIDVGEHDTRSHERMVFVLAAELIKKRRVRPVVLDRGGALPGAR